MKRILAASAVALSLCFVSPASADEHSHRVRRPVAHRVIHGTRNIVRGTAKRVGSALKALFGRRSHDEK
jgi:hypothetical protein